MNDLEVSKQGPRQEPLGFFSIFPLLGRLAWRYGKKLLSIETLVSLEKTQGQGSGERAVEDDMLDQALLLNKNHYHIDSSIMATSAELAAPVLVVKKERRIEHSS